MSTKQKSTTTSNQTQTSAPPTWTMPGIQSAADQVNAALANRGTIPAYTGTFVEAPDAALSQGVQDAYTRAAGATTDMTGLIREQLTQAYAPRDSSAELRAAIEGAIAPTYRQLNENVLPGITNSALMSGAYSNDRALGVVPQAAIRDANMTAQEIAAQLGYQGFQAEEDRATQRLGMLPGLTNNYMQMSTAGGDLLNQAMQTELSRRTASTQDALARHDYGIAQPYEGMDIATQLLARLSGGYGTQTSSGRSESVQQTTGLGPILQGAMGVGMLGASMFGGGGIGALGGAASGAGAAGSAAKIGAASSMFNPMANFNPWAGAGQY